MVLMPYETVQIGQQVDQFKLVRKIGSGGMGDVFLAHDAQLDREVALKIIRVDVGESKDRFMLEAKATAKCSHENIVKVYAIGDHEKGPYMALEYLTGETLEQRQIHSPLKWREVVRVMADVAEALNHAHDLGIVHRDLKRSNIFLTDSGLTKVLDFGIAKFRESNSAPLTGDDEILGTVPYLSPEQWRCEPLDHRTDIWAVGINFWYALAGKHPYGKTLAPRLFKLVTAPTSVPTLEHEDLGIPRSLARVVDKCLAKKVGARYSTAAELHKDLLKILNGEDVAAQAPQLETFEFGTELAHVNGEELSAEHCISQFAPEAPSDKILLVSTEAYAPTPKKLTLAQENWQKRATADADSLAPTPLPPRPQKQKQNLKSVAAAFFAIMLVAAVFFALERGYAKQFILWSKGKQELKVMVLTEEGVTDGVWVSIDDVKYQSPVSIETARGFVTVRLIDSRFPGKEESIEIGADVKTHLIRATETPTTNSHAKSPPAELPQTKKPKRKKRRKK